MSDGRISGLSDDHAKHARTLISQNAQRLYNNRSNIHYTQKAARWEGIARRCNSAKGEYPRNADCSSLASWILWDAIARTYGVRDLVNNAYWRYGYTGSMYQRGKAVRLLKNIKIGDLVFYGGGRGIPSHVAISLGGRRVLSHGGESGPLILDIDYRSDRRMIRRYI